MRRSRVLVFAALLLGLSPSVAHAEPPSFLAPRDPLDRFARNLALFALSGLYAKEGILARRPPLSLVMVAWPTTARLEDETERDRVPNVTPTWTMPAGGRRPMFYATFVDVRF